MDTLAVTRALGDYKHKEYIISEPEILVYTINEQSKYCLLGTDGFWDVKSLYFKIFLNFNLVFFLSRR